MSNERIDFWRWYSGTTLSLENRWILDLIMSKYQPSTKQIRKILKTWDHTLKHANIGRSKC